ncbi:hypothetical protein J4462_00340 [Candidatus Pacearchaeota archaeon]|nr:hypothetical protein [Candidatus Pacearchaeota archaeon]
MKKITLSILLVILISQVMALEVEKEDKGSTIIQELGNPSVFDFIINNPGQEDRFEIYSLLSASFWPKGKFTLPPGKKRMEVKVFLAEELRKNTGSFQFAYQIKGDNSGIFEDTLLVKIVSLKDTIEIKPLSISPEDDSVKIIIKNKENAHIENLKINFDSLFFTGSKELSFLPFEEKEITLELNKNFEKTEAGTYIVTAELEAKEDIEIEEIISYLEKEGTSIKKESSGFVLKTSTITKTNEGNIPVTTTIEVRKNIISRIFTINNPEPLTQERKGFLVLYSWRKNLAPKEFLIIETTTNFTIPFIILAAIIILGVAVRIYTLSPLVLNKKTSLVRTKHGEFALKIFLHVKARKNLKEVKIIDMLPHMAKLYEKFGKAPDEVDPKTKRLFWHFPHLEKGEKRVVSYIIYSKMNVIGRFELPRAMAIFKTNDKRKEVLSDRAYFAAED